MHTLKGKCSTRRTLACKCSARRPPRQAQRFPEPEQLLPEPPEGKESKEEDEDEDDEIRSEVKKGLSQRKGHARCDRMRSCE